MKFISILRGINVSGQKIIKMDDLRRLYESLGFDQVVSYIQSGNVIFNAKKSDPLILRSMIEKKIQNTYNFHVHVELRTGRDLKNIIDNNPFGSIDPETEGTRVLVSFLSDIPEKENISGLMEHIHAPEKLVIIRKEVYLYCPLGYGKSKLSNNFLEQKLKVPATTRNWKTVLKLFELSSD